jgi:hypothetical protein
MRFLCVAVCLIAVAAHAQGGAKTDATWRTGYYEMCDIQLTNLPPTRGDWTNWDPSRGYSGYLPDVFIDVHTMSTGDWELQGSSTFTEDCEYSVDLGTLDVWISGPDGAGGPETEWLFIRVYDYDVEKDESESMDASGSIWIGDLHPNGANTVYCENGTIVTFDMYWLSPD